MNQKLIRAELERRGMVSKTWSHNQRMTFTGSGLRIDVELSTDTWDTRFTATLEETTEVVGSVQSTLTTLRDGLLKKVHTLDEMLARYDEVKE